MTDATAGPTELESLVTRLRSLIGQGAPLPAERPLAVRFGVKRHQLRRALEVLRASGDYGAAPPRRAARTRPAARGTAIQVTAPQTLDEATNPIAVIEIRLAFEPALARMAAMRATPAEIEAMQALLSAALRDGQPRSADIGFHRAITAAAHSALANAMLSLINSLDNDQRLRVRLPEETLAREREEHMAIMTAIADRDPVAAERAMASHLHAAELWLLRRQSN